MGSEKGAARASSGAKPCPSLYRFLIAAGGTGGHLYPALAVARSLQERLPDSDVTFVGTRRGLEGEIVPKAGYSLELVRAAPLRGGSLSRKLIGVMGLLRGFIDSWALVRRIRPHVVMGLGAYVSGAIVLVASLRGVPTLLLEPNAEPGLANRWLRPFVDVAACAWEETARFFGDKGVVTGNPVRGEIFSVKPIATARAQTQSEMRVLVFGGSQGSRALNQLVVESLPFLSAYRERLYFHHQTGQNEEDAARARSEYQRLGFRAQVSLYIDDMKGAYENSDLVVCRAGATTCAELSAAGRPAILVPLALAGAHQETNARMMEGAGAARQLAADERTPETFARVVTELMDEPETRERMATEARALARPGAAGAVAEQLEALALGKERA